MFFLLKQTKTVNAPSAFLRYGSIIEISMSSTDGNSKPRARSTLLRDSSAIRLSQVHLPKKTKTSEEHQDDRKLIFRISNLPLQRIEFNRLGGGGISSIAQRKHSCFTPKCPGFESCYLRDFYLYCLVCGQYWDRTHLVLSLGFHKYAISGGFQS